MTKAPWASGPGEILQHGLNLLTDDSDSNRRLAMLSIDNAVELMIKTYLGLPRRVTGLTINRKEYAEFSESFPKLLDAVEQYASDRLMGIDLGEIEWYHRLRNELYHQGNGLTVEREKVDVYAELASLLFKNLFGYEIGVAEPSGATLMGEFLHSWVELEKAMMALRSHIRPQLDNRTRPAVSDKWLHELTTRGIIETHTKSELTQLMALRNSIVHGEKSETQELSKMTINKINELTRTLQRRLEESR